MYSKKEKTGTLKNFSRQELFDYSRICDGYAQLLLKWEKREPLGVQYQQRAVDMMTRMNEGADWMFPLTSHFWTPALFDWGKSICVVCWRISMESELGNYEWLSVTLATSQSGDIPRKNL